MPDAAASKARPRVSLMRQIFLLVLAFGATLVALLLVDYYQNRHVLEPIERQTSNIYTISRFLNSIEASMKLLGDYRWDYGDPNALTEELEHERLRAAQYLAGIEKRLDVVGEEQYLLARAADITFITYQKSLLSVSEQLKGGQSTRAAAAYYSRCQPCGEYLRQYIQQLLEIAIHENQTSYLHTITLKQQLQNLQALVVLVMAVLGIWLVVLMRRLTGAVRELAGASQQIGLGNFEIPDVIVPHKNEIGQMADAFNEMKHSMKARVGLLNEKNEMERALHRRETEALELQALMEREQLQKLRSQINPHFLFNTLNVIQYTAGQEQAQRTQTMLLSLAGLLRYALASNEEATPLSREVRIVDSLFLLYHARFGNRMQLRWRISPELDLTETLAPSFLLQPLVENALKHGLAPKEEGGLVWVRIACHSGQLRISVSDNGVGMTSAQKRALLAGLRSPPVDGKRIGLYNIAARLRLLEGDCGFEIRSSPGRGTRVTLRLPLVLQPEPPLDTEGKEGPDDQDTDC